MSRKWFLLLLTGGLLVAGVLAASWAQPAPANICVPGYAREHRMPYAESAAIKREMMRREHPTASMRDWILDHRIPLELDGSNDPSNLMLQSVEESREKDKLEHFLHRAVCSGIMTLENARREIDEDWRGSYGRHIQALD